MNFNLDTIRNNKIELLDCQVEIVLKSLQYYCYSANFMFDRHRKYTTKDDEFKISLITDTYHQISTQFDRSKGKQKIKKNYSESEFYEKVL